ncbi:NAD(P)-binding protein [Schizophyllum commune Loenen D]|nr:NAD(P)-binding protein [Schizophyllum commune Loenen D]
MSQTKPLVVVFGSTGETGQSIVQGLLNSGAFRVTAVVRDPTKATAVKVAGWGATLVKADLEDVSQERLQEILKAADIVISTVPPPLLEAQTKIVDAAKAAGVKRFVPDDFGTEAPKGVLRLHDRKLAIRDYIKASGVSYTFIEVGWWKQLFIPFPPSLTGTVPDSTRQFPGKGDAPVAVTDLHHIGSYVARVLQDERTLNQRVFIWEDEATLDEAWAIAEKMFGEEILKLKKVIPEEIFIRQLAAVRAATPPDAPYSVVLSSVEYANSLYIRGDNTPEKAKASGALLFRELYPDVKTQSYKDFAEAFYKAPYVPYAESGKY